MGELLDRYGQTYAEEIGIRLDDYPASLFQLLTAALLFSARIGAPQAVRAARALLDAGLTTPDKMAAATWEHRVKILNENGYARYDESTARMLADTCDILQEQYGGDLRKLHQQAGGDVDVLRKHLQAFKGIGATGSGIFLREAQAVWTDVAPFVDQKAAKAAQKLGLSGDPQQLFKQVEEKPLQMARLVAALVRVDLANDIDSLKPDAR
ncbi:MAG: hypothetical protein E1N59_51 [Puniceicoccaceae bacterium 5H]|nr:MAG: hypothetical protein E1N59_51 [Puniceicoccaceae bacterium 5H]